MAMAGNGSNSQSMKTSNSKLAAYSCVCFRNVPEAFAVGSDVECSYVISEELQASSSDWIGLYKVGWRSHNDYIYYNWSQVPASYVPGTETFSRVTFPASKLPKDDGEFYQFCYVDASRQIRGASSPFQFKQMTNDDLIEIEDENGELLVIRTRTAVLEEHLRKASKSQEELREKIRILEDEKASLTLSRKDCEMKYLRQKEESDVLQGQLRVS